MANHSFCLLAYSSIFVFSFDKGFPLSFAIYSDTRPMKGRVLPLVCVLHYETADDHQASTNLSFERSSNWGSSVFFESSEDSSEPKGPALPPHVVATSGCPGPADPVSLSRILFLHLFSHFRLFFKTMTSSSSSDDEEASRMARFFGMSSSKSAPIWQGSCSGALLTTSPVSSA